MTKRDLSQSFEKKVSFHIQLTQQESDVFQQEMKRIGLSTKSAMGRILIRKALGLTDAQQ